MLHSKFSRRVSLYLLAFALALTSNFLFTGEWFARFNEMSRAVWGAPQVWATVALCAAIVVAMFCFGAQDEFKTGRGEVVAGSPVISARREWLRFVPSAVCYLAAVAIYLVYDETGLVRWLWVLSVVGLVVPLIRRVDLRDFWPIPFWEYLLVVLIVIAAFALRYVKLTEVPLHVDNDVAIMGLFSRILTKHGDWRWVGMTTTDHQYSEHQMLAMSMRLFGDNHYGLAMVGVLAGTATVALLYLLGKIAFNRWVGFLAAGFLAINYVHIHFSRITFGPVASFFVVLAGLGLVHGVRRASLLSFALGGMSLGAGLLSYYSARIGPLIGACMFALWYWQRRSYPQIRASYWWVAVAGALTAFGPNLVYSIKDFDGFTGRGNAVVIWADIAWQHLASKYASGGSAAVVWLEQVKRTFLAPFYFPDESTICYLAKPMLGALTAAFFALGLGFCLRRFRRISCCMPLVWIAVTFVLGGIMTIDPPFWPHLNIAVPAMVLIAAVGAERLSRQVILAGGRPAMALVPLALVSGMILSGVHHWEEYYEFARDHAGTRVLSMRVIEKLPRNHRVVMVSKDVRWEQETFRFFSAGVDGGDLSEEELLRRVPVIEKPTSFFIYADVSRACVDQLVNAFPGARRRVYVDGWKWPAFTVIQVNPVGYVELPQRELKPAGSLWELSGWRYVSVFCLGILALGWFVLFRELKAGGEIEANGTPTG